MNIREGLLVASASVCIASMAFTVAAHGKDTSVAEEAATVEVSITADEVVAARRAAYFLSTQAVGQIKAGIAEGGDLARTASAAKMLANWAAALPGMFPDGSKTDNSRTLESVWSDREGFEGRAAAYRDAALELARIAGEGDRQGASAAFMQMAGTCHACHQAYREE